MSSWCTSRLVRSSKCCCRLNSRLRNDQLRCKSYWRASGIKMLWSSMQRRDSKRMLKVATSTKSRAYLMKFQDLMPSLLKLERNSSRELRPVIFHSILSTSCTKSSKTRLRRSSGWLISSTSTAKVLLIQHRWQMKTLKWRAMGKANIFIIQTTRNCAMNSSKCSRFGKREERGFKSMLRTTKVSVSCICSLKTLIWSRTMVLKWWKSTPPCWIKNQWSLKVHSPQTSISEIDLHENLAN